MLLSVAQLMNRQMYIMIVEIAKVGTPFFQPVLLPEAFECSYSQPCLAAKACLDLSRAEC